MALPKEVQTFVTLLGDSVQYMHVTDYRRELVKAGLRTAIRFATEKMEQPGACDDGL